jgi:hypothetical protein
MRGNGGFAAMPASGKISASKPSVNEKMSSSLMNDASTSICVNSGWRSRRRSSSRKQRAIWK